MKLIKKIIFIVFVILLITVFLILKPFHSKQWLINFNGIGPIQIGMKLQDSTTPFHYQLKTNNKSFEFVGKEPYKKLINNECTYVAFANNEPNKKIVGFMLNKGVIVRMDIVDPTLTTIAGIKVGDSEQKVKDTYKNENIEIQTDKYSQDGRALNILYFSPDKKRLIVFDTDGQKVINIRVGQSEEAQLVEKCL